MTRKVPFAGPVTALALLFIVVWSAAAVGVLQSVPAPNSAVATGTSPADAPSWAADVEARVRAADPSKGAALYTQYGCIVCHGTEGRVAPALEGTGKRAATRRVPAYSAAAYIYESITQPNAYVVKEYPAGIMPQDFKTRIPEDQLYTIIAWLLTQ